MKITRFITDDKLTLLSLAGIAPEGAPGWDYAIPQPWADDLQRMGLQDVCHWFVADCSGPMAFPVLHHTGEAWAAILNHRSKAYSDCVFHMGQCEQEHPFYQFIVSDAAEEMRAEADVGLNNLSHLAAAFEAGYKAAWKEVKETCLPR